MHCRLALSRPLTYKTCLPHVETPSYLQMPLGPSHHLSDECNMGHLWAVFILSVVIPSGFRTCFATDLPLNSTLSTGLVNGTSTSHISFTGGTANIFTSCSASVASWLGFEKPVPDTFINNCRAAGELLQADINRYGSKRFEFVARGRPAMHDLEVKKTPIKYTSGILFSSVLLGLSEAHQIVGTIFACTITVVDMDVVPQRYIIPARFRVTDVATFYDVRNALSAIWRQCLYGPPERQVGYAVTGMFIVPKHTT